MQSGLPVKKPTQPAGTPVVHGLRLLAGSTKNPWPELARTRGVNSRMEKRSEERELVQRCVEGEAKAVAEFQERFGSLVYSFPSRIYHLPADEAGDFYVFVFENGRLFRRLRSFAGRVSLRKYLVAFALDHLLLEWLRGRREVETVSLDALREEQPNFEVPARDEGAAEDDRWLEALAHLPPQKAVVAKLLHAEDVEFSPAEVRYLCATSGKRAAQVLREIEELRALVREREAAQQSLLEQIDSVHAWIELYRKRLLRLEADLAHLPPQSARAQTLLAEKAELARKLVWREKQREKLCVLARRRKVTAPYKEIARILGTTVGNVASLVQRVRQEIARQLQADPGSALTHKGVRQ